MLLRHCLLVIFFFLPIDVLTFFSSLKCCFRFSWNIGWSFNLQNYFFVFKICLILDYFFSISLMVLYYINFTLLFMWIISKISFFILLLHGKFWRALLLSQREGVLTCCLLGAIVWGLYMNPNCVVRGHSQLHLCHISFSEFPNVFHFHLYVNVHIRVSVT